jgi:multidrug efflux system outer membrane protein
MSSSRASTVWRPLAALFLLAAFLAGCTVGPNYHRPAMDSPAGFRSPATTAATNSLADLPWWGVFKDPVLQDLIHTALTNNYDMRIAVSRVEQARSLQAQAQSVFFPQVGYGAQAARGRNMLFGLPNPNSGRTLNSFLGGFDVFWEVDLWGRLRRQNESAHAALLATQEAQRGIRLTLVSAVAKAYIELLELDEQFGIAKRTTNSFERTFRLFSDQHDYGLASKLELSRARAALRSVSAAIPELKGQIALKENEINVLLGRQPGPVSRAATLLQQPIQPEIPTGLPAMLLERRPDLRQAEQQLRAANAQIGAAVGDFLPKIGLTALYGGASTDLSALTSGGANAWTLAATTTGPIFQGGRLKARYRQAQAACEEARLHYQQTALNAFREVADALILRQQLEETRIQQAGAVEAYQEAVQVATDRYGAGKASYYEVLEAQQQLFPAENALAQIKAGERLVIVQLYKSLGGGWKLADDQWAGGQTQPAQSTHKTGKD